MKKLFLIIGLLAGVAGSTFAQDDEPVEKGFDKSKLFFGGSFGLAFGNSTLVNVSPQLGYRFNQYLAGGAGINMQYSAFKTEYTNGQTASREEYGMAGLNIFGRVYPIPQILLQLQPEMNYTWGDLKIYGPPEYTDKLDGKFVPCMLAGAGGMIPAGRNSGFIVMVQYDLLQNDRSPYGKNVFYSFGFNAGF
jgi:hypothetical protein